MKTLGVWASAAGSSIVPAKTATGTAFKGSP